MNMAYKIFSVALYRRIVPYVEAKLGDYQGGFRRNRSTIDQIFSIRRIAEIMEGVREINMVAFCSFEAAYDTINRNALYSARAEMGIPGKLIKLTRCTMLWNECIVKVVPQTRLW